MMKRTVLGLAPLATLSLVALLPVFAACDDTASPGPDTTAPSPAPTASPTTSTPTEVPCEPATKGPTVHKGGDVAADEVWRADESPHIVESNVTVRNGRTLTIEPCAVVRFAKGTYLQVAFPSVPNSGTLVAEGTAGRPITFAGKDGARWSSVMVQAPGTARFAHVTFEDGGGDNGQRGATVVAMGDSKDGADPIVRFDHVTIRRSAGLGAWLQRGATFMDGSTDLTIKESGGPVAPYPIQIEEHALDKLPTGSYTGNLVDEILLDPRGGQKSGSGIWEDTTIHDRGVPYHVGATQAARLSIGGREDKKLVTVTIEPGVVMRFEPKSSLRVQHFSDQLPSTAAIRALGTAEKPIILTSAAASPKAGDWQGLWFGGVPDPSDTLDHVKIEYAGGDCGCILTSCSQITEHEGAIIFTAPPSKAFITNTTFANSAGHGISEGYEGTFVDFRPSNDFVAMAGCAQTRPHGGTCPVPRPMCD